MDSGKLTLFKNTDLLWNITVYVLAARNTKEIAVDALLWGKITKDHKRPNLVQGLFMSFGDQKGLVS